MEQYIRTFRKKLILIDSEQYLKEEEYWTDYLKGELPSLNLPLDYERDNLQSFEGSRIIVPLDEELKAKINEISKRYGVTNYMVLLSAYSVLLNKYTSQKKIILGSAIVGRSQAEFMKTMGLFVNTVVFRNIIEDSKKFSQVLCEVRNDTINAYANQDYQFDWLIKKLNIPKSKNRNPIFDVMFNMRNMELPEFNIDGVEVTSYPIEDNSTRFDLSLIVNIIKYDNIDSKDTFKDVLMKIKVGKEISLEYIYNSSIAEKELENFADRFANVLGCCLRNFDEEISRIQIVKEEEKESILKVINSTPKDKIEFNSVKDWFEDTAEKFKDKSSVRTTNKSITYSELNKKANQLAHRLESEGIKKGDIVGICLEPSIEVIISMLAFIKTGAAYIPVIGKYISNTNAYVLNDDLNLMPLGCRGELYITGECVSGGYLNNEKLTKERFIDNPYMPGQLLYKTSDCAKMLEDGSIQFFGRSDKQVKIHGYRVEIGEIEYALKLYPDVTQAIAQVRTDEKGINYICGYVVTKKELDIRDLRKFLGKHIADYMIPTYFVRLDNIPLTANGKIDYKSLPEPEITQCVEEYEAPRNEIEELMSSVWKDVLKCDRVGITDDFFVLGGDSIKAIQVVAKLQKAGLNVELKDIIEYATIKELASNIQLSEDAESEAAVTIEEKKKISSELLNEIKDYYYKKDKSLEIDEVFGVSPSQRQMYLGTTRADI